MQTARIGSKRAGSGTPRREHVRPKSPSPAVSTHQVRRVSFLVSDSVLGDLKELAGPNDTMTDVFKKAIASLKYLEDRKKEGKRFFIGTASDVIESEVVLLR